MGAGRGGNMGESGRKVQGMDLVVNVMCYIRFHSLAAESSGAKRRETLLDGLSMLEVC